MNWFIEAVGLVAGTVIVVSFLSSTRRKIRIANLVGAVLFAVYGILITSLSLILLNVCAIGVQMYKLRKERLSEG